MPAHLTLRFSDRPAHRFSLEDDVGYLLGRADDCSLRVDDARVSRRHARLERQRGSWWVTDLGSKNGVRVEGRPVQGGAALPSSCWLSLGGLVARFEQLEADEARRRAERDRVRWQTSLDLPTRLDTASGLDRLLAQLLDSVLRLSGADRAFVLLGRSGSELEVAATAGVAPEELASAEFAGSVGAVEQALARSEPVVTTDAQDDEVLGSRPSIADSGIRALVCVPLDVPDRGTGVIYADSRTPGSAFTELDVEILQALASHAALALAVAGLSREVEGIVGELPTPPPSERPERPGPPVPWRQVLGAHRS